MCYHTRHTHTPISIPKNETFLTHSPFQTLAMHSNENFPLMCVARLWWATISSLCLFIWRLVPIARKQDCAQPKVTANASSIVGKPSSQLPWRQPQFVRHAAACTAASNEGRERHENVMNDIGDIKDMSDMEDMS